MAAFKGRRRRSSQRGRLINLLLLKLLCVKNITSAATASRSTTNNNNHTTRTTDITIKIGGIYDSYHYDWVKDIFEFTIQQINQEWQQQSQEFRLEYELKNSTFNCDDATITAATKAYRELLEEKVHAVIIISDGDDASHHDCSTSSSSSTTTTVDTLVRLWSTIFEPRIPIMITPGSAANSHYYFSHTDHAEQQFPSLVSGMMPSLESEVTATIAVLSETFGWSNINILHTTDLQTLEYVTTFQQLWMQSNGGGGQRQIAFWDTIVITTAREDDGNTNTLETAMIRQGLNHIKRRQQIPEDDKTTQHQLGSRINLLVTSNPQHTYQILKEASRIQDFQRDAIWVLAGSGGSGLISAGGGGASGAAAQQQQQQQFNWSWSLQNNNPIPGYLVVAPQIFMTKNYAREMVVDSIRAIAMALKLAKIRSSSSSSNNVASASSSSEVAEAVSMELQQLEFQGMSGQTVTFHPITGERSNPIYAIINAQSITYPGGKMNWKPIGTVQVNNSAALLSPETTTTTINMTRNVDICFPKPVGCVEDFMSKQALIPSDTYYATPTTMDASSHWIFGVAAAICGIGLGLGAMEYNSNRKRKDAEGKLQTLRGSLVEGHNKAGIRVATCTYIPSQRKPKRQENNDNSNHTASGSGLSWIDPPKGYVDNNGSRGSGLSWIGFDPPKKGSVPPPPDSSLVEDDDREDIEQALDEETSPDDGTTSKKRRIVVNSALWMWQESKGFLHKHPPTAIHDEENRWILYNEKSTAKLERAYRMKLKVACCALPGYGIDMETMEQTNLHTGHVRKVQRIVVEDSHELDVSEKTGIGEIVQVGDPIPTDLEGEPKMVLIKGDIIQVTQQRMTDDWALGTKLHYANETVTLQLVDYFASRRRRCSGGGGGGGSSSDNNGGNNDFALAAELTDDSVSHNNIVPDNGWFQLDKTRIPIMDDLRVLQQQDGDFIPPTWEDVHDPNIVERHVLPTPTTVEGQIRNEERERVVERFLSTLNPERIEIIKVERIQNLALWRSYVVKRHTLCDREIVKSGGDPSDDDLQAQALARYERRWLWHGTNADVMEKILQQGFNRSFCGRNATMYGKGVYFARDASYSACTTYSTPDRHGFQFVVACTVVVGEYCLGEEDSLSPQIRDPNTQELYDSTVNNLSDPEVFVTYHDAQAYPEYLITFKELPRSGTANA